MPVFTQTPSANSTQVVGTSGNDVLSGFNGDDLLLGGDGNDHFFEGRAAWEGPSALPGFVTGTVYGFGFGNDTIVGGNGLDWLDYSGSTTATQVDLTARRVDRQGDIDSYSGIERLTLGTGADRVTGAQAGLWLDLSDGADTVVGVSANATLVGGAGLDRLDLQAQATAVRVDLTLGLGPRGMVLEGFERVDGSLSAVNQLRGAAGDETLFGGDLGDKLLGEAGDDLLYGGDGNDMLVGGNGDDLMFGGPGRDRLYGGAGDDDMSASSFFDDQPSLLYGGAGNDTLESLGVGVVYGGAGDDALTGDFFALTQYGGAGNDSLTGWLFNDTLAGDAGDDQISGDAGNDLIRGGSGNDALFGGLGNDTLDGGTGANTLRGGFGDDVLTGSVQVALVYGEAGNDTLTLRGASFGYGGEGNDTLVGSFGAELEGGNGDDVLHLSVGFVGYAFGGNGNDQFVLDGAVERPLASRVFSGGAGTDSVHLEAGTVVLRGLTDGGAASGTVVLADIETVTFGAGRFDLTVEAGYAAVDLTLAGTGNRVALMNQFSEIAFVTGSNTVLLEGVETGAFMAGGDDLVFVGQNALDSVVSSAGGNDTIIVRNAQSYVETGDGNDIITITETANIFVAGTVDAGAGDDRVILNGLQDAISLGAGNDVFVLGESGGSTDIMGGSGRDIYRLTGGDGMVDISISDFVVGEDFLFLPGVSALADLEVVQEAGRVVLIHQPEQGGTPTGDVIRVLLGELTVADLSDAMFL